MVPLLHNVDMDFKNVVIQKLSIVLILFLIHIPLLGLNGPGFIDATLGLTPFLIHTV
jgi:hypothetical protein